MNDTNASPTDPEGPPHRYAVAVLERSLVDIARDVRRLSRGFDGSETLERQTEVVAGVSAAVHKLIPILADHTRALDLLIQRSTDTAQNLQAVTEAKRRAWYFGGIGAVALIASGAVTLLRGAPTLADLSVLALSAVAVVAAWMERSPIDWRT